MCFSAILGAGLTIGQGILGYRAEKARYKADLQRHRLNRQSALQAASLQSAIAGTTLRETLANNSRYRQAALRGLLETSGTALASGQNEGRSTDLVQLDLERQTARQLEIADAENRLAHFNHQNQLKDIWATAQNRINGIDIPQAPSLGMHALNTGLGLASTLPWGKLLLKRPGATRPTVDLGGHPQGLNSPRGTASGFSPR